MIFTHSWFVSTPRDHYYATLFPKTYYIMCIDEFDSRHSRNRSYIALEQRSKSKGMCVGQKSGWDKKSIPCLIGEGV
jgi:hypothetical protein